MFCVAAAGDKTGEVEEGEEEEEEEVEDKIALAAHVDAGMATCKDRTGHDDRDAVGDGRRVEWEGEDMVVVGGGNGRTDRRRTR